MAPPADPDLFVAIVALVALGGFGIYRLLLWIRALPTSPNPWGPEIEQSLQEEDVTPVCHKCFSPQPPGQWFCEHCGTDVGDYNSVMPYVCIFSTGEVLRNGVTEKFRVNVLTVAGYLLLPLAVGLWPPAAFLAIPLLICVVIYWHLLFKNLKRIKSEESHQTPIKEAG